MAKIQDVLNQARVPMNDAQKIRYSDTAGTQFANSAIAEIYSRRPDLRFGAYDTDVPQLAVNSDFPLPQRFVQCVADYVSARWLSEDEEATNSARAQSFLVLFESAISTL